MIDPSLEPTAIRLVEVTKEGNNPKRAVTSTKEKTGLTSLEVMTPQAMSDNAALTPSWFKRDLARIRQELQHAR